MGNKLKKWIVEIRLKDWIIPPQGHSSIICFEEVVAIDEYYARFSGFDQFSTRCRYEPIMRSKMQEMGLTADMCCAPDAVALD